MTESDRDYFRKLPDHTIRDSLLAPENLWELVWAVAPQLVDGFDFSRTKPVEREFRLEDWRGREADRLFEVPYRDEGMEVAVLVCVLVEHQSTADPVMPLRMLMYAVLYWERQWKDWQSESPPRDPLQLNPVLPIVLHTGNRPWTANRELSQLMAGPEALRALAPHWPILFWDVAEKSLEELLNATGAWLRSLAVVRAERETSERFLEVLRELLRGIEQLTAGDEVRWHDLMRFVISWSLHRRPREEHQQLEAAIAKSQKNRRHKKQVKDMSETAFKTMDDFIAERAAEAREEGELRAKRDFLKRLLMRDFPDVAQSVLDRIDTIEDAGRLAELYDQALQAKSLDEIAL